MGQSEVLELLENESEWLESKQISEKLGYGLGSTARILKVLRTHNEIQFKKIQKKLKNSNRNLGKRWYIIYKALDPAQSGSKTSTGGL